MSTVRSYPHLPIVYCGVDLGRGRVPAPGNLNWPSRDEGICSGPESQWGKYT